ncbi:MAG: helix-turn-helix transcriptional regulator [Thermoguttaceae bacterium]|jgi:DNA-binding XRE family transcriptional regulator
MKRTTRLERLTSEEVKKEQGLRDLIEREKPEIDTRIRKRVGEIRRAKAAGQGSQTLGQRIRAAREACGLSQVTLAATAHVSQGYLSQLEQDQREPTLSIAVRIARALGLSLDEMAANAVS